MSDLTYSEKLKLEKALGMGTGYVLGFSNRTFEEFVFHVTGINIYDEKYARDSGSKANRLRAFWDLESNYLVGKLLGEMQECWSDLRDFNDFPEPSEAFVRIVKRVKSSAPVPEISAISAGSDDKDFETLALSVRQSIDRNEPEVGLDRLHTFVVKYFRILCDKHGVDIKRETPLHSLVGGYVKKLKQKGLIESEMTERILKSSISVMEAFNKVRNEKSFAHDNEILNYDESLLIFGHVTSSIRFIEAIENPKPVKTDTPSDFEFPEVEDLPF